MKPLTAKQLIKILQENGFLFARQKGSHMIFRHINSGIIVPIPLHGKNTPLPIGTFLAIVKQSQIPKEIFEIK